MNRSIDTGVVGEYYCQVQSVLSRIVGTQGAGLRMAAELVAATIERDGIVYSFGSGHSSISGIELYYRAGGMAPFDIIADRTFGRAERLPGYAETLLAGSPISANDLLIVVSNSGRNAAPVEMACGARKRGITTIGITSIDHSRSVSSRAAQGQRLFEVCDVVIDTCVPLGDAAVELAMGTRVGPVSTLAGVFIANSISAAAAALLLERGIQPPVFLSANLDGAEERNRELFDFLRRRTSGL